jgi:tetratricopeptide (TPR) repeat protein
MILAQPFKVVAISFQQNIQGAQIGALHGALQQLEALYVYGVLTQLARFAEVQYRDSALLSDRIVVEPGLSVPQTLEKYVKICQSVRAQALFTGSISVDADQPSELKVNFRLFDAQQNQLSVDRAMRLLVVASVVSLVASESPGLPITLDDLNRLINQTVSQFLRIAFGEAAFPQQTEWAPFSQSLPAMNLLLKAHKATTNAEKVPLYEAALKEDPLLETAYTHLAKIYKNENEYEKSVVCFREVLTISRGSARNKAICATEGGIACALLGKLELAVQWWLRAIDYDPGYINPYFNLANTYEDQDNNALAEKYFLEAQRIAPDDFRTFFNLARIYSKTGAWEKALSQYRHQLESEEGDPWCHSDVATCYLNLGDLENARQHLERTVALDPEGDAGQYAQLILGGLSS